MNTTGPVIDFVNRIKGNKKFNFSFLGNVNIENIKTKILKLRKEDWLKNTKRQEVFEAHKNTVCIPVLYDFEYENRTGEKSDFYNLFKDDIIFFENEINNIKSKKGNVIRFEIVKMLANSSIPEHIDASPSLVIHSRFHVPIQTHNNVLFTINDETKNLKEGEIWEINNSEKHSVVNDSDMDRIHLIIDWKEKPKTFL